MGAWGYNPFENDNACDWKVSAIITPCQTAVERFMTAKRDAPIDRALAAVRVALDTESIHFLFRDTDTVDTFFSKVRDIDNETGWSNPRSRRRVMNDIKREVLAALKHKPVSMLGGL